MIARPHSSPLIFHLQFFQCRTCKLLADCYYEFGGTKDHGRHRQHMTQQHQYVERVNDAYRILGSRVSLDSVVHAYRNGQTAEGIAQSFPALKLEQVHGALAFYLAHQSEIDASLDRSGADYEKLREDSRRQDPIFYQKLATRLPREQDHEKANRR